MLQGPSSPELGLAGIEDSYFVSRSCEFSSSRFPTSLPIPEMKGGGVLLSLSKWTLFYSTCLCLRVTTFLVLCLEVGREEGLILPSAGCWAAKGGALRPEEVLGLTYSQQEALVFAGFTFRALGYSF